MGCQVDDAKNSRAQLYVFRGHLKQEIRSILRRRIQKQEEETAIQKESQTCCNLIVYIIPSSSIIQIINQSIGISEHVLLLVARLLVLVIIVVFEDMVFLGKVAVSEETLD